MSLTPAPSYDWDMYVWPFSTINDHTRGGRVIVGDPVSTTTFSLYFCAIERCIVCTFRFIFGRYPPWASLRGPPITKRCTWLAFLLSESMMLLPSQILTSFSSLSQMNHACTYHFSPSTLPSLLKKKGLKHRHHDYQPYNPGIRSQTS